MASGFGITGKKGRCYDVWMDFSDCMSHCTMPAECTSRRDDYFECLHHRKEYSRMNAINKEKERQAFGDKNEKSHDSSGFLFLFCISGLSHGLTPPVLSPGHPPDQDILLEIRAGKMIASGTRVTPDPRKGLIRLVKAEDTLLHFQWWDRTTCTLEDDLIVFPEEATF